MKSVLRPMTPDDAVLPVPMLDKLGLVTIGSHGRFMEMSFEGAEKYNDKC